MQSMPRRDPGSKRPLPVQREGIEPLRPPERGIRLEQIGQFSLVVLGLLCHLLLFFSLAFPYVYRYDPYVNVTWSTTGWQAVLGVVLQKLLKAGKEAQAPSACSA